VPIFQSTDPVYSPDLVSVPSDDRIHSTGIMESSLGTWIEDPRQGLKHTGKSVKRCLTYNLGVKVGMCGPRFC
jgi:hypothetical protein